MTARPHRPLTAATALAAGLLLVSGCTSSKPAPPESAGVSGVTSGSFQLVAFDSCADALQRLRAAARRSVGPYGFGAVPQGGFVFDRADTAAPVPAVPGPAAVGKSAEGAQYSPNYSGTNTHEVGVDEPDLVKTDGQRIVTVSQSGVLTVIDPGSRTITGRLNLRDDDGMAGFGGADLLLSGNHALVLNRENAYWRGPAGAFDRGMPPDVVAPEVPVGPRLLLVNLDGQPSIASEYRVDGDLVDARQVGGTARVVVRSSPRLNFSGNGSTEQQLLRANRAVIDRAGIDSWLPRYETTAGGRTTKGQVACDRVSRPASYSGMSMVTLLSFDLGATALGSGDPVSVLADGETVYGNGTSLYVASDERWRMMPKPVEGGSVRPAEQSTQIYKFDTSQPGPPRYVASGAVKGWLINQYALSEWDGHLRVATTIGAPWEPNAGSVSAVSVLRQSGKALRQVGRVDGLGKGERIYAVRFIGPTGYVVTFRQTDPLYTVDLLDPRAPRVVGELKITGYSAYLHPVRGGRLVGVGQEANTRGRTQGTQVSLFDVSDLGNPQRLAQHHVRYGHSEAEFDPHAFLWWPDASLLVLPVTSHEMTNDGGRKAVPAFAGVLLLRVGEDAITQVGKVQHDRGGDFPEQIRRSLVVGDTLWTVSAVGLMATSLSTLDTLGWVPLR